MFRRHFLQLLILTLLASIAMLVPATSQAAPGVKQGDDAPDFGAKVIHPARGRMWLSKLLESPDVKGVVLSFYKVDCKPCQTEIKVLNELYEQYRGRGLEVVVFTLDTNRRNLKILTDKATRHGLKFQIVKAAVPITARRYLGRRQILPSLFFINKHRSVLKVIQAGADDGATHDEIEQGIKLLLGL